MVIPVTRIEGVTTAVSRPSGGLIAGQGVVIDLDGASLDGMLVRSPVGMWAHAGGRVGRTGGTRGAATMRLREVLEDARAYAAGTRGVRPRRVARARRQPAGPGGAPDGAGPADPAGGGGAPRQRHRRRDPHRARLQPAAHPGRRHGRVDGGGRAGAGNVPVVVRVLENLPGNFERLGARYENAALLRQAGVQVILTSGDTHNARNLRQEAGNAVAYGLPHAEALRAVTLYPAQLWGLADYGSLEPARWPTWWSGAAIRWRS
jgi:hypothetical protein